MSENVSLKILFVAIFLFLTPLVVSSQTTIFNIDSNYDLFGREQLEAELVRETSDLYFYIEKGWWDSRTSQEQNDIRLALFGLGEEFTNRIYPVLISTFGSESKPGIDRDPKITVFVHQIISDSGGYFNSGDGYSKFQNPKSNEREMVYLNTRYINTGGAKSFLAHEFSHLITINQKDLLRNATEEVWLNEARAEYVSTLLGYDNVYKGSNLEKRVTDFLTRPSDSLTEWQGRREDYGVANLFIQYLVDHYGIKILTDSLQSSRIGIDSLNYALEKNGFSKDFSQIFRDWSFALLVNDCQIGAKYCYLKDNLKNIRITPVFYYLPRTETVLSAYHNSTYWSANWHRFIGGGQNLLLEFEGASSVNFEVPYLLCDFNNNCSVGSLVLDSQKQTGKISFSEFNARYSSFTIIPFVKGKTSGFKSREDSFPFSWKVTVQKEGGVQAEAELISRLLAQIEELKKQILETQAKINGILASRGQRQLSSFPSGQACQRLENDLYFGMMDGVEVSCLQDFLRNQGQDVYPEGLVTGNFLSLTSLAVIRFQEKYAADILAPLGLQRGTGYVGVATRAKINQIIGYQ